MLEIKLNFLVFLSKIYINCCYVGCVCIKVEIMSRYMGLVMYLDNVCVHIHVVGKLGGDR